MTPQDKVGKKKGPKGNWEKLVERYNNLPYPYQCVVREVLKPMMQEKSKSFFNRKIIRKIYHGILQREMNRQGINYTQLYNKLNEKHSGQLNVKTYESFRKDMTINSYLFKDACDILHIPYTEKKSAGKSHIILKELYAPVKTNTVEIMRSVPEKKSLEKMKNTKKWDDTTIKYEDKKQCVTTYQSDFLTLQGNLLCSSEWVFRLLDSQEKKILEQLINALQFLEVEMSEKK